jgi:hypothetical protein
VCGRRSFARVRVVAFSWVPALDPADEEGGDVCADADGWIGGASIWCVERMGETAPEIGEVGAYSSRD